MTLIQEETDNRDLIELLQELDIIIFRFNLCSPWSEAQRVRTADQGKRKISLSILYDNELSKINSKIRRERYQQT